MKKLLSGNLISILVLTIAASGFAFNINWYVDRTDMTDPYAGWNVLNWRYSWVTSPFIDGFNNEWDYYQLTSIDPDTGEVNFRGVFGYLVTDPQKQLCGDYLDWKVMPCGGNLAAHGVVDESKVVVDFMNFFDVDATAGELYWDASEGYKYGHIEIANGAINLSGQSANLAWDLYITDGAPELNSLGVNYEVGKDVGTLLPGEHWVVNASLMITAVEGTVTDLETGVVYPIQGYGYHERAFGGWGFLTGGWDFWYAGDNDFGLNLQTYHKGLDLVDKTDDLDFLILKFKDGEVYKSEKFSAQYGQLGWKHEQWIWDTGARYALPADVTIKAKNSDYFVIITGVADEYVTMLSDVTFMTEMYAINNLYTTFHVEIYKNQGGVMGDLVEERDVVGGGEFSHRKTIFDEIDPNLFEWTLGQKFKQPFPF